MLDALSTHVGVTACTTQSRRAADTRSPRICHFLLCQVARDSVPASYSAYSRGAASSDARSEETTGSLCTLSLMQFRSPCSTMDALKETSIDIGLESFLDSLPRSIIARTFHADSRMSDGPTRFEQQFGDQTAQAELYGSANLSAAVCIRLALSLSRYQRSA